MPPEADPNNEESDSNNNESEEEPARASRETPRQHGRARGGQRRRPQEREPEDFNFMPQHANPGGNQEPNAGNNENMDPNPPIPPQDQQNPAPQPDVNQQQGNAGQDQPPHPQQQPYVGQRQQQVPPPNQQQQVPDPDATQEALNRLMEMLRQYPHYAQALDPLSGRMIYPRLVPTPMRPMDVAQQHPLDYTTPQTIKFYNKGIEKLTGEPFDGSLLFTWLIKVQDKALLMAWLGILTIDEKVLTTNFSEITLERVRAHAQLIQEEGGRAAQNSTMLLTCLKNSITNAVYTKVYLEKPRYVITLIRQPKNLLVEDGICFLKVVIDAYHSNTRSSTIGVRKQIAHLDIYMKDVAKGDVLKLCAHTRSLLYELNAAGETTMDLLTNLLTALQKAPDGNFQRWLSNQIDLWSVKQKDWKDNGSDLMEEAELYYKEAKSTGNWGKKVPINDSMSMYAFQATSNEMYQDEVEKLSKKETLNERLEDLSAFTAQIKQFYQNNKWDKEHHNDNKDGDSTRKWKSKAPKDGESTSKMVLTDGKRKKYHWCEYHKQWTIHSPKECRKQPTGNYKGKKGDNKKASKYSLKKKAYLDVKAALATLAEQDSSDDDSNTSNSESDSNTSSIDGKNYSDEEGSDSS
jgi:hypothetical protein